MSGRTGRRREVGRIEVLGAWLRVWTPPRDVDVPPVPVAKVAALGAAVAVAVALFVVLGVPAIERSNDDAARRRADVDSRRRAVRNRRIAAQQRPHRARGGAAGASAGRRRALVARLEVAIGADARARVRAGELDDPIRRVECEASPGSRPGGVVPEEDPARARGGYSCTAVTADIPGHRGAALGYPFQGVADFRTGRLTWCKTNPPPGEQVIPDPRSVVALPAACRDPGG